MFLPFIISEHLPRKKRTYLGQRSGQVSSPYFSQVENHLTCSKQSPPPPFPSSGKNKGPITFYANRRRYFQKAGGLEHRLEEQTMEQKGIPEEEQRDRGSPAPYLFDRIPRTLERGWSEITDHFQTS